MEPTDPLQAVTHGDPYPFYARLRAGPPLAYDASLKLWVASRAALLDEVFTHPAMRVRPAAEPVPAAIAGQPAGEVFARLVRMNDGAGHQPAKRVVEQVLAGVPAQDVEAATARIAAGLLPRAGDADALNRWMFDVPVRSVASLLGFGDAALASIAASTRAFVACLSHLSTAGQLAEAHAAAMALGDAVARLAQQEGGGVAAQLRAAAGAGQWDDTRAITANLVGLLSQTYEATAGLVGNSLVALSRDPAALEQAMHAPNGWLRTVRETARFDSPVQNTRRFAAEAVRIAGVDLPAGAPVLLVLAAANRDAQANPDPDVFDPQRAAPCLYSFSRGAHACPGQELACRIAAAALQALHAGAAWPHTGALRWSYRPSGNGRLPVFQ
ncbi:cytochrome P450 [Ramlibacter sp.]|uniref:cytochrome P450 n=1 Tax=Ramlibacter sp. TaxID=1917967 RepID=UPI0017A54EFC|nr:cytochrome P450 [Ramlibacter sp.]MBA2673433.1 cytochrome P450 [Ramlibacter sp.]